MNKKIFAFDMDGTILNSNDEIPKETLDVLKIAKSKGHVLAICTGRAYFDVLDRIKNADVFSYIICNNGTYFYDLTNKSLQIDNQLPKNIVKKIMEYAFAKQTILHFQTNVGSYRVKTWDAMPTWLSNLENNAWHFNGNGLTLREQLPKIIENEVVTQVAFGAIDEITKSILQECQTLKNDVQMVLNVVRGLTYLDFNPLGINKLSGLKTLAQHLNIDIKDTVAFGDSQNDLEMLSGAGYGIAMGNGTDDAKKAAKEIIGDHDSDAIAIKVKEIIS